MKERDVISRRKMISGLGMGLFAAAAPMGLAVERSSQQESPAADELQTQPLSIRSLPSGDNVSHGLGQPVKWIRVRTMVNKPIKGSGRLRGRKARIRGGDSGVGRAAAIAYAKEGVDVAINYYATGGVISIDLDRVTLRHRVKNSHRIRIR